MHQFTEEFAKKLGIKAGPVVDPRDFRKKKAKKVQKKDKE